MSVRGGGVGVGVGVGIVLRHVVAVRRVVRWARRLARLPAAAYAASNASQSTAGDDDASSAAGAEHAALLSASRSANPDAHVEAVAARAFAADRTASPKGRRDGARGRVRGDALDQGQVGDAAARARGEGGGVCGVLHESGLARRAGEQRGEDGQRVRGRSARVGDGARARACREGVRGCAAGCSAAFSTRRVR
jgi:hypothetical protein